MCLCNNKKMTSCMKHTLIQSSLVYKMTQGYHHTVLFTWCTTEQLDNQRHKTNNSIHIDSGPKRAQQICNEQAFPLDKDITLDLLSNDSRIVQFTAYLPQKYLRITLELLDLPQNYMIYLCIV